MLQAKRASSCDTFGVQIEADHLTTRRTQQLSGDLADETEADHRDALAQLRAGSSYTLQRDRADGRRGGEIDRAPGRHATHKVSFHADEIGVVRLPRARARHQIAGRQIADAFTHGDHFARRGIADVPSLRIQLV